MEDFPTILQPKDMKITLFPHQLTSVYMMEKLEREKCIEEYNQICETRLGINADPTGYGKTLAMITLIVRDKMIWDINDIFKVQNITDNLGDIVINWVTETYERYPCTLVLMSQSIISQWEKELNQTNLSFYSVVCKNDVEIFNPYDFHVILVTPTMYNILVTVHSKAAWKRFIFDEPGHIKVPGMKKVQAGFFWFVTASPSDITNKHGRCRKSFMMDIVGNNIFWTFEERFNGLIIKNNLEYVKSSFNMPVTNHHYYKCYMPVLNAIDGLISGRISSMIEADNIQGAITALGGQSTDNIIVLIKTQKLREKQNIQDKIDFYIIKEDSQKVNWWSDKRDKIDAQIAEVESRFQDLLGTTCNICMDSLVKPVIDPNCQNLFCGRCLLLWLKDHDTCPLCRQEIQKKELIYIKTGINSPPPSSPVEKLMTKMQTVLDIIEKNKNGKFLVFSEYDNTFRPICNAMKDGGITYAQIIGTIAVRDKNIDDFKSGKIKVLFLNSINNGAGLNLQEATDIILYHSMPAIIQTQILGRANRIGRKISLNVHHLTVDI